MARTLRDFDDNDRDRWRLDSKNRSRSHNETIAKEILTEIRQKEGRVRWVVFKWLTTALGNANMNVEEIGCSFEEYWRLKRACHYFSAKAILRRLRRDEALDSLLMPRSLRWHLAQGKIAPEEIKTSLEEIAQFETAALATEFRSRATTWLRTALDEASIEEDRVIALHSSVFELVRHRLTLREFCSSMVPPVPDANLERLVDLMQRHPRHFSPDELVKIVG